MHYAFVDDPAYDVDAEIKSVCDGTTKQCQIELQKFDASINEVGPITDKKIILPKKQEKEKEKNSSKPTSNTSHKNNSTSETQMATDEELQKNLDESEKALKATEEELNKLKDKEAKRATEEEEKEKAAKKAAEDEEKEKEELEAKVARLEKVPVIDKIISAQLSAGIISANQESETREQMLSASLDELSRNLKTSQSYEAKLKSLSANVNVPYLGSDSGSFDVSLEDIDDEQLLMEVAE